MALSALPLCSYCQTQPALTGDNYCCEGCRVLSKIHDKTNDFSKQNLALTESLATKEGNRVRFECVVEPIACQACLQSLATLNDVFPEMQNLEWNREESTLSFDFLKGNETPIAIFECLKEMGLAPRWKTAGLQKIARSNSRQDLLRLGVTAALAGNLMLFSIPIYGGVEGPLRTVFEWIQFFLFLPVLLWSARPFYKTAWISFRQQHLSVDLPLVFAFLAGSFFSVISLAQGGHDLYFDSLAGFVFLILASRTMLERSLAWHLKTPGLDQFFENPVFEITRQGQEQTVLWSQIKKGDVIHLTAKSRLPVDGILLSPSAEFETSWMNGEKNPQLRLQGARLDAGITLISEKAKVSVSRGATDTAFAALLKNLGAAREKIRSTQEAKWGSVLVFACFLAVTVLFIAKPDLGFSELSRRGVALLIVACPCALSFGAPLARARAGQIAFRWGFWFRDPFAWDIIANSKKIAFDKTGTLTGNLLRLDPHSPMLDERLKRIILSLENVSNHPVAESLRKAWGPLELFDVKDAGEIIGQGVEGKIEGEFYELKSSRGDSELLKVELFRNGKRVVGINLQDAPVDGLSTTWNRLAKTHELYLISGDRSDRVHNFARDLGLPKEKAFGSLNPSQKLRKIEEIKPDLYFGDGTNDLLALQSAPVSISVAEASLEAKSASDVLMLKPEIERLPALFEIAQETRRLIRQNLAFALIYNVTAGTAALLGFINPLMAALLMPAASLLLLGSTLLGTKKLRLREKNT